MELVKEDVNMELIIFTIPMIDILMFAKSVLHQIAELVITLFRIDAIVYLKT